MSDPVSDACDWVVQSFLLMAPETRRVVCDQLNELRVDSGIPIHEHWRANDFRKALLSLHLEYEKEKNNG